jgi:hypothetical protein
MSYNGVCDSLSEITLSDMKVVRCHRLSCPCWNNTGDTCISTRQVDSDNIWSSVEYYEFCKTNDGG